MIDDPMRGRITGHSYPASRAVTIVPSDSETIPVTRGVYVGGAGSLKVRMHDGSDVTFVALAAGVIHPLRVQRVYADGTDATDIIGVY